MPVNKARIASVTASKILGHSSIQMTMRYAHPGEKTMRAAAEKLAQLYEQTQQKVETKMGVTVIVKPEVPKMLSN